MGQDIPAERQNLYKKLCNLCRRYPEHLLDYRQVLGKGYKGIKLHGLGAMQNIVDKTVANRMKKRGMTWGKAGASANDSLTYA